MRKIQLMKPWITDVERQAVADVLDSGWLTEGEKVAEFEEKLAKYVGVKHAVVVPNATIGLELAISSVSPPGSDVVVPAFSHPATMLAARRAGCYVWFNDVCRSTGNINEYSFDDGYGDIDVVVPVSWGGTPLSPEFYASARERQCIIVEDAACSLGSSDRLGVKTGCHADATVFSFHPRKIITTGEGGVIVTDLGSLADRVRAMKNFGQRGGTNAKMSDINAAIGVEQLNRIDDMVNMRLDKAKLYDELLRDTPYSWRGPNVGRRTYQSYCAYVHHRDRLIRDLAKLGIETQVGTYYIASVSLPFLNARALADHLLTLPLHHEITEEDQEFVVGSVVSLLKTYEV